MKKHLFGMALLMCLVFVSGMASAQTIDDIQVYDALGAPASPYDTQSVTVTGTLYVDKLMWNSGTHVIQGATGGIQMYNSAWAQDLVEMGDNITVTGTVAAFSGEIQLSSPTLVSINSSGNVLVPLEMTPTVALSDYENVGNFVAVTGEVVDPLPTGDHVQFNLSDGTNSLYVFCDVDTGIILADLTAGETIQVLGELGIRNGEIQLKPRMPSDLVGDPGAPSIMDVALSNYVLDNSDPVTVSATVTDDVALTAVDLFYRDSDDMGTWSSMGMTSGAGDSYSAVIPGGHPDGQIHYYIVAEDGVSDPTTSPAGAPENFYSIAVGFTPIYDIQYVHPDTTSQDSPLLGETVNIRGIITAEPGQTNNTLSMVVQELEPDRDTDSYGFGGILVFHLGGINNFYRGDTVKVSGEVEEYFGVTELVAATADAIVLDGFGDQLPPATVLNTHTIADRNDLDGDGAMGEAWESVWIRTFPSAVVDIADFVGNGIYGICDQSVPGLGDTLYVDPTTVLSYVPTMGDILKVEGYGTVFSGYRIVPISDEFIINTGASPVDDTPMIVKAGGIRSIAPNPFNPATQIKFVVGQDNLVQLTIYNIRGEKVRTLIEDRLSANEYTLTWDGKNDAGVSQSSGAYVARLRVGSELTQVAKMSLVK